MLILHAESQKEETLLVFVHIVYYISYMTASLRITSIFDRVTSVLQIEMQARGKE